MLEQRDDSIEFLAVAETGRIATAARHTCSGPPVDPSM